MEQCYRIAGLTVAMDSFGKTLERAKPYACEEATPDLTIYSDLEEVRRRQPELNTDECEYRATGGSFYYQLLNFDGMLLHASAVAMDGYGYLFTAPCGTGKSTHTGIWRKVFGDRAVILNDDKPALRLENGIWYVYGTPWSGKNPLNTNMGVPLGGICFLHQAKENSIEPFRGVKVIYSLMEQTARPESPELRGRMMELIDSLMANVAIWKMGCNMEPEAAMVSFETMSKGRKEV